MGADGRRSSLSLSATGGHTTPVEVDDSTRSSHGHTERRHPAAALGEVEVTNSDEKKMVGGQPNGAKLLWVVGNDDRVVAVRSKWISVEFLRCIAGFVGYLWWSIAAFVIEARHLSGIKTAAAVGGSRLGSWMRMRLISMFWLPSGCLCNVQTLSACPRPPAKFSAPFVLTDDCGHPSAPTCFYGVCFYFKPNEVLYVHRLGAPLPRGRWPSSQVSVNSKCSLSIEEDSYALILPCKRKNKA